MAVTITVEHLGLSQAALGVELRLLALRSPEEIILPLVCQPY